MSGSCGRTPSGSSILLINQQCLRFENLVGNHQLGVASRSIASSEERLDKGWAVARAVGIIDANDDHRWDAAVPREHINGRGRVREVTLRVLHVYRRSAAIVWARERGVIGYEKPKRRKGRYSTSV
jgi:hypothetical protein